MVNINDEDADYINKHNIQVSSEELPNEAICLYFDDGKKLEDGEPDELILISKTGETCNDMMARAVVKLKERAGAQ